MKKLFRIATGLLLLVGVLCTLSSCKKDSFSSKDLIGKWAIVGTIYRVYVDGKLEREEFTDMTEGEYADEGPWMILEFRSGGKGSFWVDSHAENPMTWTLDKSTLSMIWGGEAEGDEIIGDITSLTSDRMGFMWGGPYEHTEDGEHWREEEIYEFQKVK